MKSDFLLLIGPCLILAGFGDVTQAEEPHWSLQPLPSMRQLAGTTIDDNINERLAEHQLPTAKPALAHRQIRRLSLMLTGLPPEPTMVKAFVEQPTDNHYARLVDRYLQSPRFGERWARHWMDVVRYAETYGYEWNHLVREAWRYRDYLIRAFNQDLPFDQLIREHIAGDLLDHPRANEELGIYESLIGGAFYRFGETGHDDCVLYPEISLDVMDNQIDTLSKSFQALTVSCARCHDHKLDDIPQKDYYALLGVMASSRQVIRTIDLPNQQEGVTRPLTVLKKEIRKELAQIWTEDIQAISKDRLAEALKGIDTTKSEHPFHAWQSNQLDETAEALRIEHERRVTFNRKNFEVFGNFTSKHCENTGWGFEGLAIEEGFVSDGDFSILPKGDNVLHKVLPAGFYSHSLSQKFNAALRSPLLPEDKRYLSYQSVGERGSVCRTIIANCTLPYFHTNRFNSPKLSWHKVGLEHLRTSPLVRLRTYVEWATVLDDQGYPVLNMPQVEYHKTLNDPRSYFCLTKVFAHDVNQAPFEELEAQLLVFNSPITSNDSLVHRYREILQNAVNRWSRGLANASDVYWINAFIEFKILNRGEDTTSRLGELVARYRALEDQLQSPKRIVGMVDPDEGFDVALFGNGEVTQPKDTVQRGYVTLLENLIPREPNQSGSGRKRIAELVAHPENPLTARVMANRLWHYLFGHGLVRSVDDFGTLGDLPSHPELLDYLARRLIDSGWSLKSVIREIVLSDAFRQSSAATEIGNQVDPENRLLHRYPSRRLEAEVIRDSMLWASGRLNLTMFGPSINPYRENDVDRRKLYAGPLDGDGRRSLYLKVTRMGPSKMLELFNFPDPSMTRGRRDLTNVPSQALGLLNHPFVHQEAERHAKTIVQSANEYSLEALLRSLSVSMFGRQPDESELQDYKALFHELSAIQGMDPANAVKSVSVWKDVIHMFFNLKEFLYVL